MLVREKNKVEQCVVVDTAAVCQQGIGSAEGDTATLKDIKRY